MKTIYLVAAAGAALLFLRKQYTHPMQTEPAAAASGNDPYAFIPKNGVWEMLNGTPLAKYTPLASPNAQASFVEVTDGTAALAAAK